MRHYCLKILTEKNSIEELLQHNSCNLVEKDIFTIHSNKSQCLRRFYNPCSVSHPVHSHTLKTGKLDISAVLKSFYLKKQKPHSPHLLKNATQVICVWPHDKESFRALTIFHIYKLFGPDIEVALTFLGRAKAWCTPPLLTFNPNNLPFSSSPQTKDDVGWPIRGWLMEGHAFTSSKCEI